MISVVSVLSSAVFAALVIVCIFHARKAPAYRLSYIFLAIAFLILLIVSASNILERIIGIIAIDRVEEYIEILISPFILLYAYSWSATLRLERNRRYVGELHHRVKNNLQIVESLLDVQAMLAEGSEARVLIEAKRNIGMLGISERLLLERGDTGRLDMGDYLGEVLKRLAVDSPSAARCDLRCASVALPGTIGVHCALMLSLWLSGASAEGARLSVSLDRKADGRFRLSLEGAPPPRERAAGIVFQAITGQLGSVSEADGSFILDFEAEEGNRTI